LVAGALFSVPFILFSMTGGFLADRFSKRTVTIGTKLFEIAVMLLAAAGLAWQNLHLEMVAIFLASTQAAFFGPSKYGLLPELLPEAKLSWGNGVIELGTFLAAIAGLVSGAFLADVFSWTPRLVRPDLYRPVACRITLQPRNHGRIAAKPRRRR
jgi:acyl-[acyl-carrier-protein]-phospholipid O-acyltransferase / long-chain-fatty-acid--[acyl-carrier-protein] ligase